MEKRGLKKAGVFFSESTAGGKDGGEQSFEIAVLAYDPPDSADPYSQ